MSFLQAILRYIVSFFNDIPSNTGLVLDHPEDIERLPKHELFAGGGETKDWRPLCPPFRYQGPSYWCTAFAGTSIASIFERLERGGYIAFSPLELFYRSGGQLFGNYLINTANSMKESVVAESDVPTPLLTAWNQAIYDEWKAKSHASHTALENGKTFAIKSAASVRTDKASLKAALASSPLMIAIGIGRGYFDNPAPRVTSYNAYHAVVLTHIDEDGFYHIFDSLTQKQGFNGHHTLSPDYEILSALSFIDLPDNWADLQNRDTQERLDGALDHYGEKRVLDIERQVTDLLADAVRKNPTVSAMMGREWTICINAVAYGGYSVQDLLNHMTNIRRTGKPIWNLNKKRNAQ